MVWGERGELGLATLSIYTCGAEHQGLEDVGQGNDALDARVRVHHHQAMHLAEDTQVPRRFRPEGLFLV